MQADRPTDRDWTTQKPHRLHCNLFALDSSGYADSKFLNLDSFIDQGLGALLLFYFMFHLTICAFTFTIDIFAIDLGVNR